MVERRRLEEWVRRELRGTGVGRGSRGGEEEEVGRV
jgi:hypothetical protein